jgi:anti-sigma28 factor (negative regulator of flagellin synthesis)
VEKFAASRKTMKISGIGSLFSATIAPTLSQQRAVPVEQVSATSAVDSQSDAVVVSAKLQEQQRQTESANADRASRRDKIAAQIKSGTYEKPSSEKMAEVLLRDLM